VYIKFDVFCKDVFYLRNQSLLPTTCIFWFVFCSHVKGEIKKMLSKRIKFRVVILFGIIYFVSFWLLTIGYFTPYWVLIHLVDGKYDNEWFRVKTYNFARNYAPWNSYLHEKCYSMGVVTRSCDSKTFDWFMEYNIDYICK
jgi:hypothetical protein